MPLDPPTPLSAIAGFAENRHEIKLGIAHRARAFLELAEDLLQAHDRRRLQKARPAQARLNQGKRKRSLFRAQLLDRQPFAAPRNEVPVEPLWRVVRIGRLGDLRLASMIPRTGQPPPPCGFRSARPAPPAHSARPTTATDANSKLALIPRSISVPRSPKRHRLNVPSSLHLRSKSRSQAPGSISWTDSRFFWTVPGNWRIRHEDSR